MLVFKKKSHNPQHGAPSVRVRPAVVLQLAGDEVEHGAAGETAKEEDGIGGS